MNDPALDRIAGRAALVTGGGNGLGRAIATALAGAGASVVVVGRNRHRLDQVADALGPQAEAATCDISDARSVETLRSKLADLPVSILINNAGIPGPVAPLIEVAPNEWDDVFAANVRGIYLMCRAFLPAMIDRGAGDVINIASVSGKRPLANRTPYVSSKMAVIGLTATLAHEVGPLGITVNSLSPGPVRGPRMERNFALDAQRTGRTVDDAQEAFTSRAALRRLVEEEEVGQAVLAMLSMPALSGADIDLSAGMIAR